MKMIAHTITAAANIQLNTSFSLIVITYFILIFDVCANISEDLTDARDSRLSHIPRISLCLNPEHLEGAHGLCLYRNA